MNQDRIEFLISHLLDGTISSEERRALEEVLAVDEEARALLAEYRKLDAMVKGIAVPELRWEKLAEGISAAVWRGESAGREEMIEQPVDEALEYSITQYIDGDLSEDERAGVERQIAENPAARRVYDEYRSLEGIATTAWPVPQVRWERLAEQIGARIDEFEAPAALSMKFLRYAPRLAMAASVLIAIGLGIFAYMNRGGIDEGARAASTLEVLGPAAEKAEGRPVVDISVRPSETFASGPYDAYASPIVYTPARVEIAGNVSGDRPAADWGMPY